MLWSEISMNTTPFPTGKFISLTSPFWRSGNYDSHIKLCYYNLILIFKVW
jgi:hypothetical protein